MKLDLTVNGIPGWIELLSNAPECRFTWDGADRAADVERPEPGVYSILMNGRCYDVRIEEAPGALVAVVDGFRFEIVVRDPRRLARRSQARGAAGVESIVAPMPGKVVKVLAAAGDLVEAGQGLVVVEAMKMQNELKSVRAGRVLAMLAKEGAAISAGETLATLEA